MKISLLVLLALGATTFAEVVRYDGYQMYTITPKNNDEVKLLQQLEASNIGFNFWTSPMARNMSVQIMVPPHLRAEFSDMVTLGHLNAELMMDDVQKAVEAQNPLRKKGYNAMDWESYHTLDEVYDWLRELADQFPEVTLVKGGETYEGREILGVHISYNPNNADNAIFFEGTIHAREWISCATVTFMLNELLTSQDKAVRDMAESYDWYIFPIVNPDGYVYTHTNSRFWRKTRTPYSPLCYGADPNRNWDAHWMEGGASSFPCDETFAGSSPFSEVETRTLSEYIRSVSKHLVGYVAFHSYSQLMLLPYGYTHAHLDNYEDLYEVGIQMEKSLSQRYGTRYEVGSIPELLYIASGGSMDWAKESFGIKITYTYELRDTGRYGFLLPADQIIPSGLETLDSIVAMIKGFEAKL